MSRMELMGNRLSRADNEKWKEEALSTARTEGLTTLATTHKAGVMCQQLRNVHAFDTHCVNGAILGNRTNGA
jgi:hypothetical protein